MYAFAQFHEVPIDHDQTGTFRVRGITMSRVSNIFSAAAFVPPEKDVGLKIFLQLNGSDVEGIVVVKFLESSRMCTIVQYRSIGGELDLKGLVVQLKAAEFDAVIDITDQESQSVMVRNNIRHFTFRHTADPVIGSEPYARWLPIDDGVKRAKEIGEFVASREEMASAKANQKGYANPQAGKNILELLADGVYIPATLVNDEGDILAVILLDPWLFDGVLSVTEVYLSWRTEDIPDITERCIKAVISEGIQEGKKVSFCSPYSAYITTMAPIVKTEVVYSRTIVRSIKK